MPKKNPNILKLFKDFMILTALSQLAVEKCCGCIVITSNISKRPKIAYQTKSLANHLQGPSKSYSL